MFKSDRIFILDKIINYNKLKYTIRRLIPSKNVILFFNYLIFSNVYVYIF